MTDDNKKAPVKTEQPATRPSEAPESGLKRRELLRNVGIGGVAPASAAPPICAASTSAACARWRRTMAL